MGEGDSMAKTFSDAYQKAKSVITKETFGQDWDGFLKKDITSLLGDDGLNKAKASSLKKLHRDIIYPNRLAAFFSVTKHTPADEAEAILAAAGESPANKRPDRAAAIKFLRHLYYQSQRGSQSVWVCSPPKAYTKWTCDELKGLNTQALTLKLGKTEEIFNPGHMKNMFIGTQDALKWCQKVLISLANAKSKTNVADRKLVKRWFADENTPDKGPDGLDGIIDALAAGFKKIRNVCNSNQLIFSDDTLDRSTQPNLWKTTYALVRNEPMDVIYVEKVLLGRSGTKLEWAITIVHELSHREVKTKDHFYSESGLKPNSGSFTSDKALENADNWAFYAANVNGELTNGKIKAVLKAP
jgi:hypothetical protein